MTKIKVTIILFAVSLAIFFGFKSFVRAESSYDLKADSLIINSAKCEINQVCNFTAKVKNLGETSLTDFSGLSKDEVSHNLADYVYGLYDFIPGTFPTLSSPFNPADIFYYKFHGIFGRSGSFNLTFAINQKQRLIESNTNNNSTSRIL